jgi:hypothetical protein
MTVKIVPPPAPISAQPRPHFRRDFVVAPKWILREIVRTRTFRALPLILAAYSRMHMRGMDSIGLTRRIWIECGDLDERERSAILAHLRKIPWVMTMTPEHRMHWRYRLALGSMWKNPPPMPDLDDEESWAIRSVTRRPLRSFRSTGTI